MRAEDIQMADLPEEGQKLPQNQGTKTEEVIVTTFVVAVVLCIVLAYIFAFVCVPEAQPRSPEPTSQPMDIAHLPLLLN
ncbi:hypothetical protein L5515_012744 [Caenorhabditis briggsae]|uniref:Uncharacterized protein n=1 Tax=Caenorhabditis briggsae TaxID=6238 RepID=A0AAE9D7L7_CAEBR|nr:hypothetical protein L3Y34_005661 [Caenorhabditis briggsae]UMM31146.1 hypothetical protein L5515_012744 [Caenorhabditis briggsae]